MGLTQVSTDGVKNDAITKAKIPANQIEASELADNAVDTNAIADQAVALSKLPHGDGSSNGKFLRANNGADPSFESIPAGTTINNNADYRLISGDANSNELNAESNLTFNGGALGVTGTTTITGNTSIGTTQQDWRFQVFGGRTTFTDPNSVYTIGLRKNSTQNNNRNVWLGASAANDNSNPDFIISDNAGTEKFRFRTSGGLAFNGDSAAANALDDYEEGTFTPYPVNGWGILNGGATSGGSNAAVALGKYIKIGSLCYIFFTYKEGSSSGASFNGNRLQFYGLPFQSEGQFPNYGDQLAHPIFGFGGNCAGNAENLICRPDAGGATTGGLYVSTSGGYGDFTGTNLGNNGQIWFSGCYKVHP